MELHESRLLLWCRSTEFSSTDDSRRPPRLLKVLMGALASLGAETSWRATVEPGVWSGGSCLRWQKA